MPRLSVTVRYAAQNHTISGVFVLWRIVPAVRDTWYRQARHCQRVVAAKRYACGDPQRGQAKPSGQRHAAR